MGNFRKETPAYHLGALQAYHRPTWWKSLLTPLFLLGGWLVLLWVRHLGIQNVVLDTILWSLGVCILLLAYEVWRAANWTWSVYERGMVERKGKSETVYRWDEVESISSYVRLGQAHSMLTFIVKRRDGKTFRMETPEKFTIPSGEVPLGADVHPAHLVRRVYELAYDEVLERTAELYWRGDPLDFKHFRLSKGGIQIGNELLPWAQIDDISGDGNSLRVYERMRGAARWTLAFADSPNRRLLPDLLTRTQERPFLVTAPEVRATTHVHGYLGSGNGLSLPWQSLITVVGLVLLGVGIVVTPLQYRDYTSTNSRIERANTYMTHGQYFTAIDELNAAALQSPDRALVFATRCKAYREIGDFIAAYTDCEYALELRPNYDYALVNLGLIFYRQDQFEAAILRYNAALSQNPDYFYAYCNRAYSYKLMGYYDATLKDFDRCLQVDEPGFREQARQEIDAIYQITGRE